MKDHSRNVWISRFKWATKRLLTVLPLVVDSKTHKARWFAWRYRDCWRHELVTALSTQVWTSRLFTRVWERIYKPWGKQVQFGMYCQDRKGHQKHGPATGKGKSEKEKGKSEHKQGRERKSGFNCWNCTSYVGCIFNPFSSLNICKPFSTAGSLSMAFYENKISELSYKQT